MTTVIDRRTNPKDKSLGSRQRFIRRAASQIKKAIKNNISNTDIKDFGKKGITVPVKGVNEPTFNPDQKTGNRNRIMNGNKDFVEGDRITKPTNGGGNKGREASDGGEGEDEFEFTISQEEFVDYFFEDLELPNLVEKEMKELMKFKPKRAGYTSTGTPASLSVGSTMKKAIARRIALDRPKEEDIDHLILLHENAINQNLEEAIINDLAFKINTLKNRMKGIPFIDKTDLRYRNTILEPKPNSKAVMIMLMDVSGSMGEREKDIAKRFFILLYLLLTKKYENVEMVFVRHHTSAEETNEHDFFYKRESGGTIVSSGLKLVNEITNRYNPDDYNLYLAQASDGDNFDTDKNNCLNEYNELIPKLQYFCYLDIPYNTKYLPAFQDSSLWGTIAEIERSHKNMNMAKANGIEDIWQVFTELFSKGKNEIT